MGRRLSVLRVEVAAHKPDCSSSDDRSFPVVHHIQVSRIVARGKQNAMRRRNHPTATARYTSNAPTKFSSSAYETAHFGGEIGHDATAAENLGKNISPLAWPLCVIAGTGHGRIDGDETQVIQRRMQGKSSAISPR
uniref:Uncharacterized protein n=1 Tax=Bionectria ochroleuca TaxID=29856 RepID=A0A8H7TR82_BIOOC